MDVLATYSHFCEFLISIFFFLFYFIFFENCNCRQFIKFYVFCLIMAMQNIKVVHRRKHKNHSKFYCQSLQTMLQFISVAYVVSRGTFWKPNFASKRWWNVQPRIQLAVHIHTQPKSNTEFDFLLSWSSVNVDGRE